jgi:hypothetical protein
MDLRPVSAAPKTTALLLGAGLLLQAAVHALLPPPSAQAKELREPPSPRIVRLVSLDEPIASAKALMFYLQAFDNQPGISIAFRDLDYTTVCNWLENILRLDPRAQYPLLSASRLYAEVPAKDKQRRMLEFVHQRFLEDPGLRWPWLAHAVILARHRLADLPLAAKYAQALRVQTQGKSIPSWAKQMEIFIREDMNELQSAKILIGALLESGQISDPHETRFLVERLKSLEGYRLSEDRK